MSSKKVAVIGAGVSGIAAAIRASENGASVTVLEHMEKPLKKLLLTGNGRCNFSNTDVTANHYHGDRELIDNVLRGFTCDDMLDFMAGIGVEPLEVHYRFGENGYFYPSTNNASTVRDALLKRISELDAEVLCECVPVSVSPAETGFTVGYTQGGQECRLAADAVIFASGSNAAPATGSDSSVYGILRSLSVPFHTFLPALCAVKSDSRELKLLQGLRADGEAYLTDDDSSELFTADPGEIQFNEHSVSGLPVMHLSRYAAIGKKNGHRMHLDIILKKANNKDLRLPMEKVTLNVTGTDGFQKAVCCSGGVEAGSVDPDTLMFKTLPGIYFAGELIDVDGDCGGYNLHFAFATGLRAGNYASL